jgi:hypothetical protein
VEKSRRYVSDDRKPGSQDSMSFRVQWSQKSTNLIVNVNTEAEDIDTHRRLRRLSTRSSE